MYFMNTIFDTTLMEGVKTMSKDTMADLNGLANDLKIIQTVSDRVEMLEQRYVKNTYVFTDISINNILLTSNGRLVALSHYFCAWYSFCGGKNLSLYVQRHKIAFLCTINFIQYVKNKQSLFLLPIVNITDRHFQVFIIFMCLFLGTSSLFLNLHDKRLSLFKRWISLSQT